MKQVTEWVETRQEIDFAVKQLEKYGTRPFIMHQTVGGQLTGLVALFREDMNEK